MFPFYSLQVIIPPSSFPFPPSPFPFSVSSPFFSCTHPSLFISLSTFPNPFLCFQSVSSPPPLFLSFSTFSTPFSASIPSSSNAQSPHSYLLLRLISTFPQTSSPSTLNHISQDTSPFITSSVLFTRFHWFPSNLISPFHPLTNPLSSLSLPFSFQSHFSISPFNKSPFLFFSSVLLPTSILSLSFLPLPISLLPS